MSAEIGPFRVVVRELGGEGRAARTVTTPIGAGATLTVGQRADLPIGVEPRDAGVSGLALTVQAQVDGWAVTFANRQITSKYGISNCSATPAPPPPATSGAAAAAQNWARSKVGQNYDRNLCLTFVFAAYSAAGVNLHNYVTVGINGNTYPVDIWGHFNHGRTGTGTPPAGALVFYAARNGDRTDSHVTLSVGGGSTVSTSDGVYANAVHYETVAQHSYANYLGWWLPV